MPWKFLFLSGKFLKAFRTRWALLFLSLWRIHLRRSWGGAVGVWLSTSLESLEWEEDVVMLWLVKNVRLLGSENSSKTCRSAKVYPERSNLEILYFILKTVLEFWGCSSWNSVNLFELLNNQTGAKIYI